jgi:HPt (histidine-containing phosphotransfer) domain-containing protein
MTNDTLILDAIDEHADVPLVDTRVLGMLRTIMPAEEFEGLLRLGMVSYQEYLRSMREPHAAAAQIRAQAHKLKGSAGSLGLRRLSLLAAWLEEAAPERVPTLLREVAWSAGATHQMLVALGYIGAPLVDIPV